MNRLELLEEMHDMAIHNKYCYSKDILMNTPKEEYIDEWNKENEKLELIQELINEEKAEEDILKMIGNQILNFERVLLNQKENYQQVRYYNETENFMWRIFNCIYFSSRQEEKYLKKFEIKYKKQLSKQAKKDKAINKSNASSFHWEDEI